MDIINFGTPEVALVATIVVIGAIIYLLRYLYKRYVLKK